MAVGDVIAVEIYCHRASVPVIPSRIFGSVRDIRARGRRTVRVAVGFYVDAIMKVGNIVMGHNVTRAVKFDSDIRAHWRREDLIVHPFELRPQLATPADEMVRIIPANKMTVGNIKAAGTGVIGEDAGTDVFEATALYGQPLSASDELSACQNSNL